MYRHLRPALTLTLTLAVAACAGAAPPSAPPTSSPSIPPVIFSAPTDGPEKLVVDLDAAGATAHVGSLFAGDPFNAQGGLLCIGPEPVQLFVFGSVRDREAAVSKIDPANPSNMGTTMVDWNGRPRMWQRDRMIIVYLGEDAATETTLRSILGEPFATGQGRPPLPGPKACA